MLAGALVYGRPCIRPQADRTGTAAGSLVHWPCTLSPALRSGVQASPQAAAALPEQPGHPAEVPHHQASGSDASDLPLGMAALEDITALQARQLYFPLF